MPITVHKRGYDVHHVEIEGGKIIATIFPGSKQGAWSAKAVHNGCDINVYNRDSIEEAAMAIHMLYVTATTIVSSAKSVTEMQPDVVQVMS